FFFFSSRRRHTRFSRDWSSDVCSSDLGFDFAAVGLHIGGVFSVGDPELLSFGDNVAHINYYYFTGLFCHVGHEGGKVRKEKLHKIGRASCRERVSTSGGAGVRGQKRQR